MANIIIVEDHELMGLGIKTFIEEKTSNRVMDVVVSSEECLSKIESDNLCPDLVIMDVELDGDTTNEDGYKLSRKLLFLYPQLRIIIYSMHTEGIYVHKAREIGAKGYVSKSSSMSELLKCIEIVLMGGSYFEQELESKQHLITDFTKILTPREYDVMMHILTGDDNKKISEKMKMKKHSVEVYCSRLYEKAFVKNREGFIAKFK